jgi:hypothetical protein
LALTAQQILTQYDPWAEYLRGQLSALDASLPHSWAQLQLALLDAADEQCGRRLRAGSASVFADVSDLYEQFLATWAGVEDRVSRDVPEAAEVLNDQHREHVLPCLFRQLVDTTVGDPPGRRMVRVYDGHRVRSTTFELVSYLLGLRQRLKPDDPIAEQPLLTHLIKVDAVSRERAVRGVDLVAELESYLDRLKVAEFATPEWARVLQSAANRRWLVDVWRAFMASIGFKGIARFQWRCFETLLSDALTRPRVRARRDPALVVAGTGFGKTEAFLFPVLFFSVLNLARRTPTRVGGPDAVLVYPRVDLCNNQLERCLWYVACLRRALEQVPIPSDLGELPAGPFLRVAIAHGGLQRTKDTAFPFSVRCPMCRMEGQEGRIQLQTPDSAPRSWMTEAYCTAQTGHDPADLLALGLGSETGRFVIAITTADTLHRRLMDVRGRKSLWRDRRLLPRFIILDEIHVYDGQHGSHIANLCRRLRAYLEYLPPTETQEARESNLPPIFVGSSATIGNPAEVAGSFFSARPERLAGRIFSPSASERAPFGREYVILLKTPPNRSIPLPGSGAGHRGHDGRSADEGAARLVPEQSTLLQSAMALWHCAYKTMEKRRMLAFVDSIDSVWRVCRNLFDAEWNIRKGLFRFRTPSGRDGMPPGTDGGAQCPRRGSGQCSMPPHHLDEPCWLYQEGECWWTMLSSDTAFLRPMRVLAHSSGQRRSPDPSQRGQLDEWDCLITTSTLEVGFDHPELMATVQYKAPPSPASFQQRKGRGGRALEDTPTTLMVLGNSPGDLFAFRHERRFFRPSDADLAVRVDPANPYVRRQHLLSAVFDYLSWCGLTEEDDLYRQCRVELVLQHLADEQQRRGLYAYARRVYGSEDLPESECRALVDEAIERLRQSIIPLSRYLVSMGQHDSLQLFRRLEIPERWIVDTQRNVADGVGGEAERVSLQLLEAAQSYRLGAVAGDYLHPPDYFSRLPVDAQGRPWDRSWIVPTSFVATPIGGMVNIRRGSGTVSSEPRLQALSAYLPGGFRFRWDFKLWYGPWIPVQARPGYADIADLCRSGHFLGSLGEVLGDRPIPARLSGTAREASLTEPREMSVFSDRDRFYLDPSESRIVLGQHEPLGRQLLRDPTCGAQTADMVTGPKCAGGRDVRIAGASTGIQAASHGPLTILRLFFANIVTCYLKDSTDRTKSLVVRFWDSDHGRQAIPAVRLITDGLTLTGRIGADAASQLQSRMRAAGTAEEHYWRSVYRLLWRELLRGGSDGVSLPSSFECVRVLTALKFLDWRSRSRWPERSASDLSQAEALALATESRDLCSMIDLPLFADGSPERQAVDRWDYLLQRILDRGREMLDEEVVESFSCSVGQAVAREMAERTNTNIDMVEISSEVVPASDGYDVTICAYDQLQGGSGTAQSFVEGLAGALNLADVLGRQSACPTAEAEQQLLEALAAPAHSPEVLYAMVHSDARAAEGLTGIGTEALYKLRRMLASLDITAFYQGVAENYRELEVRLLRVPTAPELAVSVLERPPADPRGRAVAQRFAEMRGHVTALIPRVEELIPLCVGSCPDCLGDARVSLVQGDAPMPDRHLLRAGP